MDPLSGGEVNRTNPNYFNGLMGLPPPKASHRDDFQLVSHPGPHTLNPIERATQSASRSPGNPLAPSPCFS